MTDFASRRPFAAPRFPRLPAYQAAVLAALLGVALAAGAQGRAVRNGDYIAAVVNQELVTAGEVERRIERAQADASRAGMRLPPRAICAARPGCADRRARHDHLGPRKWHAG
jgi:hypothetical protein